MDIFGLFESTQMPTIEKAPWMEKKIMELVTEDTLERVFQECINCVEFYSLDLETTGLNNRVEQGQTVDKVVGVCVSPDGIRGYYIPLFHRVKTIEGDYLPSPYNIKMSVFRPQMDKLMKAKKTIAFHNAEFDQEFLEFNGNNPWGVSDDGSWDDTNLWHDSLVLAHLDNSRRKKKGLKLLSWEELGYKMIELEDLFPKDHVGPLDFSLLDPSREEVLWYAAGDAICTHELCSVLLPRVVGKKADPDQSIIYKIEKNCAIANRWMKRNLLLLDRKKVKELILIGQKEYVDSIFNLYERLALELGRDIMPPCFHFWKERLVYDDPDNNIMDQLVRAKDLAKRTHPDPVDIVPKKGKEFPWVYYLQSSSQLGMLFDELDVPNLEYTEKSGQVKTAKEALDRIIKKAGDELEYMRFVSRFREVHGGLTKLYALWEDSDRETDTLRIGFNPLGTDTGRFSSPGFTPKSDGYMHGKTRYNLQSTPATYDPNKPECMVGIRECFVAPEGFLFAAIDYSGVELRIVTNKSGEPLWLKEFFRCADCDTSFSREEAPPQFCPECGSDKIGDIHSLSAINFYGPDARKQKDEWKKLRGKAKNANFALCYGGGPKAVQKQVGCSKAEAHRIKKTFDQSYQVLKAWWDRQHAFARKHGYVVTEWGRKYPLPDINHEDGYFRSKAERNATNGPVQGTSADLIKVAMSRIYRECKRRGWLDRVRMVITMHDELCFLIDVTILEEALAMIKQEMTWNALVRQRFTSGAWNVFLQVDIELGKSWAVPWNYSEMSAGKKPWVEELKPYVKWENTPKLGKKEEEIPKMVYRFSKPLEQKYIKDLAESLYLARTEGSEGEIISLFSHKGVKLGMLDETPLLEELRFDRDVFLREMIKRGLHE